MGTSAISDTPPPAADVPNLNGSDDSGVRTFNR
jgi:hypothetical protein